MSRRPKPPLLTSHPFCDCQDCKCTNCPDLLKLIYPSLERQMRDFYVGPVPHPPTTKITNKESKTTDAIQKTSRKTQKTLPSKSEKVEESTCCDTITEIIKNYEKKQSDYALKKLKPKIDRSCSCKAKLGRYLKGKAIEKSKSSLLVKNKSVEMTEVKSQEPKQTTSKLCKHPFPLSDVAFPNDKEIQNKSVTKAEVGSACSHPFSEIAVPNHKDIKNYDLSNTADEETCCDVIATEVKYVNTMNSDSLGISSRNSSLDRLSNDNTCCNYAERISNCASSSKSKKKTEDREKRVRQNKSKSNTELENCCSGIKIPVIKPQPPRRKNITKHQCEDIKAILKERSMYG